MSINLKDVEESFKKDEGIWIDYPNDDDVKLKIRPLYPDKANLLSKKATKKNRTGGKEIDSEKLSRITLEFIIEDFKGITIGEQTECTPEALTLLAKYCDDIVKFAIAKSSEIADAIVLKQDEQLKN
jgi:hypothetical protein